MTVPPATCRMVCARSGTKSGNHVFASYQPIPRYLCQNLRTIGGFLISFRSSDSLSRFPTGFLIFAVTLPQGRQVESPVKTSALQG